MNNTALKGSKPPINLAFRRKRVPRFIEIFFDITYLLIGTIISALILKGSASRVGFLIFLSSAVLILGDSFHLIPRIIYLFSEKTHSNRLIKYMNIGKLVTSVTMTEFYIILWTLCTSLLEKSISPLITISIYFLGFIRIVLCLSPKNGWLNDKPDFKWKIIRNIPFLALGTATALLFGLNQNNLPSLKFMWSAIALSFLFYLPVVIFSDKKPAVGMLMLPKTVMYIWMLVMLFNEAMLIS